MKSIISLILIIVILFLVYYNVKKEKFETCNYNPKGTTELSCRNDCIESIKSNNSCGSTSEEKSNNCSLMCQNCDSPQCLWVKNNVKNTNIKCNFSPWGADIQACQDRCFNLDDRELWGGDKCTENACKKICENCNDRDYCKWLGKDTSLDFLESNEDEVVDPNIPKKQTIRAIPGNGKIIIQWVTNELQETENEIMGYIIQYYKTFTLIDGIITKNILEDELDNNIKNKNNTYLIDNLENGKNYSISITAINEFGSGEQSDIVSVTPSADIKLNM
jgi:hypothetical protein